MKKSILKSVFALTAFLLIGGAVSAADVSASINVGGSLYGTDGFKLDAKDQKDGDLAQLSLSGDKVGASVKLWGNQNDGAITLRGLNVWYKPVSNVQITVGDISGSAYCEQLYWWQKPDGGSIGEWNGWAARWHNSQAVGNGIKLAVTPMDGLTVTTSFAPGFNAVKEYDGNTDYSVEVKKSLSFGSVAASFRDDGKDAAKSVYVGADFNSIAGVYAFVDLKFRLVDSKLAAVVVDNYLSFSKDALSIKLVAPVTIRMTDDATDYSYMTFGTKVAYSMGAYTPYLALGNQDSVIAFGGTGNKANPLIKLGAEWSVEKGSFDVALQINNVMSDADVAWSIPFTYRVSF